MFFGIYGVYNSTEELMYIGSSHCKLETLEDNHREWKSKKYGWSNFRGALVESGQDWNFVWIQKPRNISKTQAEIEEGALIRFNKPRYNKDMFPYEHSVRKNRVPQV